MELNVSDLARMIDHSLLHPTMTDAQLADGCRLADHYGCATVCIKPYAIPLAAELLQHSSVNICTVTAFPHGSSSPSMKIAEAVDSCEAGAQEIDLVVNIGKVLSNDWRYVKDEIAAVQQEVASHHALLKVIFETDYLQDQHIIRLCKICSEVGAAFVKTSTGFGFTKNSDGFYSYEGATEHNIRLMRKHADPEVAVKAAGGIRTLQALLQMRSLGVTRVGATATAAILDEAALNLSASRQRSDS